MVKIAAIILGIFCILGTWFYSRFQINLVRNQIVFEENIESVVDSLAKMEQLLKKFPVNTRMVNYFIDDKGYLYLGAERISPLKGAINNSKVRNDLFFETFTDSEINQFFYLMAYLLKNHIDAANLEKPIGRYLFNYRRTEENKFTDLREIMLVENSQDTLNSYFRETFKILDRKMNLILLAPREVK